jgi:WD40 repeat protein
VTELSYLSRNARTQTHAHKHTRTQTRSLTHPHFIHVWLVLQQSDSGFDAHTVRTLRSHLKHRFLSVVWSPHVRQVASGSCDKTVKVCEKKVADTFECLSTLSGHNNPVRSVCFSPCGTKIVSGGGGMGGDFSIRIWDVETRTQIGSPLAGHKDRVWSVCFSPCGTKIVSGGGWREDYGGGNGDFSIRIWNAETGTQIGLPFTGHSDWQVFPF